MLYLKVAYISVKINIQCICIIDKSNWIMNSTYGYYIIQLTFVYFQIKWVKTTVNTCVCT